MDGYRLNRMTLVLALTAATVTGVVLANSFYTATPAVVANWPRVALTNSPAVWLVVAAYLARWDATPVRYAVLLAVLFTLAIQAVWFALIVQSGFGNAGGITIANWYVQFYVSVTAAPVLLAVTAVVPAAVGWWQRRRDQYADEAE